MDFLLGILAGILLTIAAYFLGRNWEGWLSALRRLLLRRRSEPRVTRPCVICQAPVFRGSSFLHCEKCRRNPQPPSAPTSSEATEALEATQNGS